MSDLLRLKVGNSSYLVKGPVANYAMVDDEGYLIVDDEDNVVVGVDYLTTNESFETN